MKDQIELLTRASARLDALKDHLDTDHWFSAAHYVGAGEDRSDPEMEIASTGDLDAARLIAALGRATGAISYLMTNSVDEIRMAQEAGLSEDYIKLAVNRAGDVAIARAILDEGEPSE